MTFDERAALEQERRAACAEHGVTNCNVCILHEIAEQETPLLHCADAAQILNGIDPRYDTPQEISNAVLAAKGHILAAIKMLKAGQ